MIGPLRSGLYDQATAGATAMDGGAAAAKTVLDAATKGRRLRVFMLRRNNGDSPAFVIG